MRWMLILTTVTVFILIAAALFFDDSRSLGLVDILFKFPDSWNRAVYPLSAIACLVAALCCVWVGTSNGHVVPRAICAGGSALFFARAALGLYLYAKSDWSAPTDMRTIEFPLMVGFSVGAAVLLGWLALSDGKRARA